MNNNETKIRLINRLIYEIHEMDDDFLNYGSYNITKQKALKNMYERAMSISEEISYPNDTQKLNLIGYFYVYPFSEDFKWQVAIEKLELFLSSMLDYINANGTGTIQANLWNFVHKNVAEVSMKKFENGHYADAVESGFKAINKCVKDIVKSKTGNEMDGVSLMREAFGSKHIIILDDLESESGRNIQDGYMQIFAGAMQGIRNPKAHDNIDIHKERAMHQIILASLLMYKLDERKS
jgi:uncharacterized protein (TIGR02391 family)